MAPETQQMADLADGAAARERQRNAQIKSTATVGIESRNGIKLRDLRALVEQAQGWPEDCTVTVSESKTYPGEPGSSPEQITIRRN